MGTVRFSGETPWEALVNDHGLDIEEEANFLRYAEAVYDNPKAMPLEVLETLLKDFCKDTRLNGREQVW